MGQFTSYLPILLQASVLTFAVAIFSLILSTFLGALGAMGKLSKQPWGYETADFYTYIVRGIPDIVLLILVYYGAQRIINSLTSALGAEGFELSVFWAGVISIGFIYGAYLTETFRGAYQSVPKGQSEAAYSLGLSRFASFYKVLLPQIIREAIPGYGNVFQVLIKSTAVLSVIGFNDLVGLANDIGKSTREPFWFLLIALLIYLVFYFIVGIVFRWLEKRYEFVGHK